MYQARASTRVALRERGSGAMGDGILEAKAKSTLSPVVICNMDEVTALMKMSGTVIAGETPILRVRR